MFPFKTALLWKKLCRKVSLCGNCQQQRCKAFTGLSICAQMVDGDVPFYLKFSTKVMTHPVQTRCYPPYDLTLRGPAYLRLVYHIHSTPVCHMCQCNTYFLLSHLRLILAKNYFIHFPQAVYHRWIYKHLAAAYNEMGTVGTNQSAVRFTDLYIIRLDAVLPITELI